MNVRRVVITGMGAFTPIGNTLSEYEKGLFDGVSGCNEITKFDASNFVTRFACEIKDYDPLNYFDKKDVRKLDEFSQYALIAADEAVNDANMDFSKEDLTKIGVVWGSGVGGLKSMQDNIIEFAKNDFKPNFNPFFIPRMIADIAAGHISIRYGLRGANYSTISACASSSNSFVDAYHLIKFGYLTSVITGGSESAVNEVGIGGFNALRALSKRNDSFITASRPFSSGRDGFVMGEGGGAIILEDLEHAKSRGAKIYAEVIGIGMSADAYHITTPNPEGDGLILVMKNALSNAGITYDNVDYINAHGTSTILGDIAEAKAIKAVFGDHAYKLNISSTKSMIGHLLGASGAVELIASILSIKNQVVYPTINCLEIDNDIDSQLNFTFNKSEYRNIDIVISNNFGFGGHNCCIVLQKYKE